MSNNSSGSRRNRTVVPEAKEALNNMKMEIANELGINMQEGYNGNLTSRENGYVGGEMVRRMIMDYQKKHSN